MRAVLALALMASAAVLAVQPPPQPPSPARLQEQFQEAITVMEARRDYTEAARLFQEVATAKGVDRGIAAKAWVYVGMCQERVGQVEAERAYRRVIETFSDQPGPVSEARARLAAIRRPTVNRSPVPTRRQAWPRELNAVIGVPATTGSFIPWIEAPKAAGRPFELVVGDLETAGGARRRASRPPGVADGEIDSSVRPVLSPDGAEAAYVWAEEPARLCVSDAGGRVRVLATVEKGETFAPLEWRPGGLLLVSATRPGTPTRLLVMSAADGTVRAAVRVDSAAPRATLSPDGRFVAYDGLAGPASDARDIFLVPTKGGEPVPLVAGEADDFLPLWTPDGRYVAFISDRGGPNGLWAVSVDRARGRAAGTPRLLERDIGEIVEPLGITARGALYYFRQVGLANVHLVEIRRDGTPLHPPAPVDPRLGRSSIGSSWGPDGRLVYLTGANTTSLTIFDPESRATRRLATSMLVLRAPIWSPDGRSILVIGTDRSGAWGSHLVDPNDGTTRFLAFAPAAVGRRTWTHDSRALVLEERGAIVRRPLDGAEAEEIFRLPAGVHVAAGAIPSLVASPRTGLLAVILAIPAAPAPAGEASKESRPSAFTLNVQTPGGLEEVFRVRSSEALTAVGWMPDDRGLVFVRTAPDKPGSVWAIGLEDRTPRPLGIEAGGLRNLHVSPNGRYLTFTAGWPTTEVTVLEHFLPR